MTPGTDWYRDLPPPAEPPPGIMLMKQGAKRDWPWAWQEWIIVVLALSMFIVEGIGLAWVLTLCGGK